jgi:Bacterial PH domain
MGTPGEAESLPPGASCHVHRLAAGPSSTRQNRADRGMRGRSRTFRSACHTHATLPSMAGDDGPAPSRVHNSVLTYSAIAVLVVFATAAVGGVLDPTSRVDEPDLWPGLVFVVVPLLIAVRGLTTGVVIQESDVLLRGWLRTRRLPREQILAVKTMPYSGVWTRGSESRLFRMLAIKTRKGMVEVPAVAARNAKAERLASRLRSALALHE